MKTKITNHVLEMLLENWGIFVTTGNWGPLPRSECGSIERQWNSDKSRYVWEGKAASGHTECNPRLGALIEQMLQSLDDKHRKVLLHRYGYKKTMVSIAIELRLSLSFIDCLLIQAKILILEKIQVSGYE